MVGTCVVYLVWEPLGSDPLERFAASYRQHDAGVEHQLVMLLNGVRDQDLSARCKAIGASLDAEHVGLDRAVLDLDAYLLAARRLDVGRLCFLNTYSEILAADWLRALSSALDGGAVGLAGATGSYESALSAAPRPLKPVLRRRFPPFPNPHIRTNGFMLERQLMLDLDWPQSSRKRQALELESGKRSITRQVWARGLRAVVVDRNGRCYDRESWRESNTFRSGRQENLLVADNRTRQYLQADERRRRQLATFAWGADAVAGSSPSPAPRE